MNNSGYSRPLYILQFDHHSSFQAKMFGWHGDVTSEQTAGISAAKQVIYDGLKVAVAAGVSKEKVGILVDEQFGATILQDAKVNGFATACPVEKSGQDEFDFEYGENFATHIEKFQTTLCKVRVCYNPNGEWSLNRRQLLRLKRLSDYLHRQSKSRFMLELLVPAEPAQLGRFNGSRQAYDLKLRPELMLMAIHQFQNCGIEPDVWKVESLNRRKDCEEVVAAAKRKGRDGVGCVVLGRGENDLKVQESLATAAGVEGFIGFTVGRANFWGPLVDFRAGNIVRETAVCRIAHRFYNFVGIFEKSILSKQKLDKPFQKAAGHDRFEQHGRGYVSPAYHGW